MTKISLGLAQLSPVLHDNHANAATIQRLAADEPDLDLLVFPELFLGGYTVRDLDRLAISLDGPEIARLREAARKSTTALVFGAAEKTDEGVANSVICIDERGEIASVYRKVQLFGEERLVFVPGYELVVARLFGVGVGFLICFDLEFPEVARSLAHSGADVLLTVSANMEPYARDHATFAVARALENGVPHIYVNQTGPGADGLVFTGGSTVVSPDGDALVRAVGTEEAVIRGELALPMQSAAREDYLRELRDPMPSVRPWR